MLRPAVGESIAWKITRLIAGAASLEECGPKLVEILTRYGRWRAGELWLRERAAVALHFSWYSPEIEELAARGDHRFAEDLVSRVTGTGEATWSLLERAEPSPCIEELRRAGITKVLAIPIRGGESVSGALLFYSDRQRAPRSATVGRIVRLGAHIGNFAERIRAENALRESNALRKAILDSATESIVTVDADTIVQAVNPAFEKLFGWPAGEIVGRSLDCVIPPEKRELHIAHIREYLKTGGSFVMSAAREVKGVRRDGSEVSLFVTIADLRLPDKRLFTAIIRDLTEEKIAIDALRRSRESLADAQRIAHVGNWVLTVATGTIEWSEEIYRIFSVDRSFQPTYENVLARIHPDDRGHVREIVENALRKPGEFMIEHRVVFDDGSLAVVHERGEVQFENGRAVRIVGTVQDVTELRRSTENLWKLYSAVEATADEVIITDREGRIEYVNPAFETATGYSFSSVLGQTPRILKSGLHRKADYEKLWSTILGGDVYRGVFINRAKDGRLLYEEKTITPIRNELGTITHFVATGRDISERRSAEQKQEELRAALQRSATEWRLTFDAISLPIILCDGSRTIRRSNHAAAALLGDRWFVGQPLDDLPPEEPWISGVKMLESTLAEGQPRTAQVKSEGTAKSWELATSMFPAEADEPSMAILVATDVTKLIELQESLRRTEMMSALGSLVAGVAHEVRNPLFGISATIDAFEGRILDPLKLAEFSKRLRTEVKRLNDVMHDLLEYGRPAEPELRRITLAEPLFEAVSATETLRRENAVSVSMPDDVRFFVNADPRRLHLAFRNLIDNAIRHAGKNGSVRIEISREGTGVAVKVIDSGSGFREEDLPHLFEPFFTKRRGGTGLGLAIVHRVIEQHGGKISLENGPEGGGVACVRLPLVEVQELVKQ